MAHWLLPRAGVIDSFVVDSADTPRPTVHPVSGTTVTDFISYYHLPSTIVRHETHKELRAVYSYYNVPGAVLVAAAAAGSGGSAEDDASGPSSFAALALASEDGTAQEGSGSGGGGGKKKGSKKNDKKDCKAAAAPTPAGHSLLELMQQALILAKKVRIPRGNALKACACFRRRRCAPRTCHISRVVIAHSAKSSPHTHSQADVDVFNALDLMEQDPDVLKELKYGPGDGNLRYYMYNWACPDLKPSGMGLVLL